MPRSRSGSSTQCSASRWVSASSRRPSRSPAATATSSATCAICRSSFTKASPLSGTTWRDTSGTSRRAESSTSATRASCGCRYRTALVSTTGRPWPRAQPSIAAAVAVPWRLRPGRRWEATATPSRRPKMARHGRAAPSARCTCCVTNSRPTSESPVSRATSPSCCSRRIAHVRTGWPRSVWSPVCAADTSRHRDVQPVAFAARSTIRGRDSSTQVPPCAGDRRAPIRGGSTGVVGSIARSTPSTGWMPADRQASAQRTAPYSPSRSVRPMMG